LLLAALGGCATETEPDPSPDGALSLDGRTDQGDLGPAPDQGSKTGPKQENGTPCTGAAQCSSGHCVDGVCCDGACQGACRSCRLPGEEGACRLTPKGQDLDDDCKGVDPACDGTCDGAGKCGFPQHETSCGAPTCTSGELTKETCDGAGGCAIKKESCGGFACDGAACKTTCASKADCTGAFECQGGVCSSPQPLGAACGQNDKACQSGLCRDGVCCDADCKGACTSCALAGKKGTCSPKPDDTVCGAATCSGSTKTDKRCKSGACTALKSDCDPFLCDAKGADCLAACVGDAQCMPVAFCDGSKLCQPKKANGLGCGGANECTSGLCELGACCASACGPAAACVDGAATSTTTLKSCAGGTCKTTQKGCGAFRCNAAKTDCLTGCTADSECITNRFCIAGTCQKKWNGENCTAAVQCHSNNCVEGVCCDKPCKDGPCESCTVAGKLGTCSFLPAKSKCPTGDGFKCVNDPGSSYITQQQCPGDKASCQPGLFVSCDAYKCASLACTTSCASHADCSSGLCDLSAVFGTQSECIAAADICHVDAGAAGPGAGTRKSPYVKIQDCLDKTTKLHVAIADGTYDENVTIARQAALWGTGAPDALVKNGSANAGLLKARIRAASGAAVTVTAKATPRVLLWGLAIERGGASASGPALVDFMPADPAAEMVLHTCSLGPNSSSCLYSKGAVASSGARSGLRLEDVHISGCGTGVYATGSDLTVRRCAMEYLGDHGILHHDPADLVVEDLHIRHGGAVVAPLQAGIWAQDSLLKLDRVRITQCAAKDGIRLTGSARGVISNIQIDGVNVGLATHQNSGDVMVANATLVNNKDFQATCPLQNSPIRTWFYNSILWKILPALTIAGASYNGACEFHWSQVQLSGLALGGGQKVLGSNNDHTDPLFDAVSSKDPYYHLKASSPCKDQGVINVPTLSPFPKQDLVGAARVKGAGVDRGALETQ
jgi:hypothetical protein